MQSENPDALPGAEGARPLEDARREKNWKRWGSYGGDQWARDGAYHQGTVWSWLLGPFALAHFRVYGDRVVARSFLEPMARHLGAYGVGSIAEVFDGDPPFGPGGCIAQAWSVGEVLRAWHLLRSGEPFPADGVS